MLANLNRMRALMARDELDAVVTYSRQNIFYLSDFQCLADKMAERSFCAMVFRDADRAPALIVPLVDLRLAAHVSWIEDVWGHSEYAGPDPNYRESCEEAVRDVLTDRGMAGGRIGYEDRYLPAWRLDRLRELLPKAEWAPASRTLLDVRAIKTPDELSRIRRATEITVKGHQKLAARIRPGVNERELVGETKTEMFRHGADGLAFVGLSVDDLAPYVHIEEPSPDHLVRPGDVLNMDMGCSYLGYSADCARSYACGEPRGDAAAAYRDLCERQKRLVDRIVPGAVAGDIHDATGEDARRTVGEFPFWFCGHGLGIDLHEEPMLRHGGADRIAAGMVICLELARWLYDPTQRIMHVEDTVIVTETGADCLTEALPRELLNCGA